MQIKNIFIYIFFLTNIALYGQQRVDLTERIADEKFDKSQVAIPIFRIKHDSMQSSAPTKRNETTMHAVKFPDMKDCNDSAYMVIFFGGAPKNSLSNNVPVLIGNYNQTKGMKLWIDYNCNYNFTDDGPFIQISKNFKYFDLIFNHSENPEGQYVVRLSRFNFKNNSSYYFMLEKYFKNEYPTRNVLNPNFAFREQQMRTLAQRIRIGKDSLTIGLYDGNANGLYNDEEEDAILIGDFNTQVLSSAEADGAITIDNKKNYILSRRGVQYEVSQIDKNGKSLVIKIMNESVQQGPAIGTKLKFKFKNHQDKMVKLRKYGCKKMVLYFFDWSNPPLKEDTVALNLIHQKYGKKVQIIMLNYGNNPGLIKNYVQYGKIGYTVGISNKEINKLCKIESYPSTIFLKKRRKVKISYTTPAEILKKLEEKSI